MTPPPCYIAAPYGDPSPTIRAWHVARACMLGRLAARCGYVPSVVHAEIAAGVFGDDSDPAQRAAGMALTLAKLDGVIAAGGAVWALNHNDKSMSVGTQAEWDRRDPSHGANMRGTWSQWRSEVEAAHPDLLPAWDALAVRPDAIGEWCEYDVCTRVRWHSEDWPAAEAYSAHDDYGRG